MDSPLFNDSGPIVYYRINMEKLLHLINIRPNVAFAIGIVTCFTSTPQKAHLEVIIHIFRYLKDTFDLAKRKRGCTIWTFGYSDSDFLKDIAERRSTLGYLMSVGTSPIS